MTPTFHEFSPTVAAALRDAGLDVADAHRVVSAALAEDLRYGPDLTTEATVPAETAAVADLAARRPGVLAGVPVTLAVFDAVLGDGYQVISQLQDGSKLAEGDVAIRLRGPVRGLLTAERTALNMLCHCSGVATLTAEWVDAVRDTGCVVRDSRKTLPGLRLLQKYAVRCGGGVNHRLGLGDAVLVKDNHVVAAGSVSNALDAVRRRAPGIPRQVEVQSLDELSEVLAGGAEFILLDNFTAAECREAVERNREAGALARFEASGGITLDTVRAYAESGVDYVAIGALTHSAPALDLGMDLVNEDMT